MIPDVAIEQIQDPLFWNGFVCGFLIAVTCVMAYFIYRGLNE
jgi:hypothetical protein